MKYCMPLFFACLGLCAMWVSEANASPPISVRSFAASFSTSLAKSAPEHRSFLLIAPTLKRKPIIGDVPILFQQVKSGPHILLYIFQVMAAFMVVFGVVRSIIELAAKHSYSKDNGLLGIIGGAGGIGLSALFTLGRPDLLLYFFLPISIVGIASITLGILSLIISGQRRRAANRRSFQEYRKRQRRKRLRLKRLQRQRDMLPLPREVPGPQRLPPANMTPMFTIDF